MLTIKLLVEFISRLILSAGEKPFCKAEAQMHYLLYVTPPQSGAAVQASSGYLKDASVSTAHEP